MDFDVEMDDAMDTAPIMEPAVADIIPGEEQEPGEVEEYDSHIQMDPELSTSQSGESQVILTKVHIRGLDNFNPKELKAYIAEHSASAPLGRIEWIDDTSANLPFASESAAQEAIIALAAIEIADATQLPPLHLIPAKRFSGKPEASLQIRFATSADKKEEGAAARSRFYLLNPEYDPEERRKQGKGSRYNDRSVDGGYRRNKYRERDQVHRDRAENRLNRDDIEEFDVSLYDDDAESRAKHADAQKKSRRPDQFDDDSEPERLDSRRNAGKELFPDRRSGRQKVVSRGRSASPERDRDGDASMGTSSRPRSSSRSRDRREPARNRANALSLKDEITRDNNKKELFPTKMRSGGAAEGKAQMDQVNETQVLSMERAVPFARAAQPTTTSSTFNIRGIAAQGGAESGIAIKGRSSAKELFPDLLGNAGKELFADRLEGRGRRRQRAEDLFH